MRVIGCTIPQVRLVQPAWLGAHPRQLPPVFPNPTPSPRILDTAREAKQCPSRDPQVPPAMLPWPVEGQERPGRRGRPRPGGRVLPLGRSGGRSQAHLPPVVLCHGSPRSPPTFTVVSSGEKCFTSRKMTNLSRSDRTPKPSTVWVPWSCGSGTGAGWSGWSWVAGAWSRVIGTESTIQALDRPLSARRQGHLGLRERVDTGQQPEPQRPVCLTGEGLSSLL